jgi:hypothetical protein
MSGAPRARSSWFFLSLTQQHLGTRVLAEFHGGLRWAVPNCLQNGLLFSYEEALTFTTGNPIVYSALWPTRQGQGIQRPANTF